MKIKNVIQNVILSLTLVLVLGAGVVLTGCGVSEEDTTLTLMQNEITIVLSENEEEKQKDIALELSEDNVEVWFTLSNPEIITIEQKEKKYKNYIFNVKALQVGECDINFVSKSNSNQRASLKVKIVEQVSEIAFTNETDIYLTQGSKYSITGRDLNVLPNIRLINQVKYSIAENRYGLKVSESGVIDATEVTTNCRVEITAQSKYDESIISKTFVSVISGLSPEAIEITETNSNVLIYSLGEQIEGIELVKSNELSNILLKVEALGYSAEELDYSSSVNGVSVQASISSGELYLQSINIGRSVVSIFLVPSVASKYVDPLEIRLEVMVIDLPNSILLNGVKLPATGEVVPVYDYYDAGFIGTRLNFQVYPEASENAYVDEIELSFDEFNISEMFNFFVLKNGIPIEQTFVDSKMIIESGTELYIRAKEINDLSNTNHNLTVQSIKAREYGLDVTSTIVLELKKGIQTISVPEEIRLKVGGFATNLIDIYPQNADASQIEIRTSSSKIEVSKVGDLEFKVTAKQPSEAEYVYFSKPNGGEVSCKVIIFEELKTIGLDIEDVITGKVSEKTRNEETNELTSAIVKVGSEIGMSFWHNEGATITDVELIASQSSGISINRANNTFTCLLPGDYYVGVKISGYNENGDDITREKRIVIGAYRAIKTLTINRSSATCYTSETVGYFKEKNLSTVSLTVQAYPQDAEYAQAVNWQLTDESGNPSDVGLLDRLVNSPTTTYSIKSFYADQYFVIATATITQYGETFSISCRIKVENARKVNQVLITNVPNNNLYFNSQATSGTGQVQSFQIENNVYPSSALNKKVRYLYRTEDDMPTNDPIFNLTDNGKVTPIKAGRAKVLVCAEDSFVSSTDAKVYATVYVTIQDGKSEKTAFHIKSANDLLAIGRNAETMSYYYVLTQNIDLNGVRFEPIGRANKLPFTGKLSGKNSFQFGNSADNWVHKYYSITGVNLNYSYPGNGYGGLNTENRADYLGLFYQLSPNTTMPYAGMPACGTVEDLSIRYSNLEINLSEMPVIDAQVGAFSHYIGGVTGAVIRPQVETNDYASIKNVKVEYVRFKFTPSMNGHIAYVGGLVGAVQNGNIVFDSSCRGAIVSGNDIAVVGDTSTNNVGSQQAKYYIGGMVGLLESSTITGRFSGIANNVNQTIYSTSFGNQNIDVTINVCNLFEGQTIQNAIKTTESALGGIVGVVRTSGKIANCTTENLMFGKNNIGGIVGSIETTASTSQVQIIDCFSSSKLRGNENIGGIIGKVSNTSNNVQILGTYVQNYDDGKYSTADELPMIKGYNNLGGIVGLASAKIEMIECYSASYITRELGNETGFYGDVRSIHANGETNIYIGGLIGNSGSAETEISKCYTNFILASNTSAGLAFVGNKSAIVSNSYIENLTHEDVGLLNFDENHISGTTTSFFVGLTNAGYEFIIAGVSGTTTFATIAGITTDNFSAFSSEIWAINSGEIPFLKYGEYGLVELAPVSVEAKSAENATSVIQTITTTQAVAGEGVQVEIETKVLFLDYHKALDNSLQSKVEQYNTVWIADYIEMDVQPTDGYIKRFIVESDNPNVLEITQNGEFRLLGLGSAKITIKSKLNINKFDEIYVQIIYATNGMMMLENQSNENSAIKSIVMYKNQDMQIYPTLMTFENDEQVQTQIETSIQIEYTLTGNGTEGNECVEIGEKEGGFSIVAYSQPHVLMAKNKTITPITLTARPYYLATIGNSIHKIYLENAFNKKMNAENGEASEIHYDASAITITVKLGATAINVVGTDSLQVRAGEIAQTTIRVTTTEEWANENIQYSIYDSSNRVVASSQVAREETKGELKDGIIDFALDISLSAAARDITENQTYTVRISPTSNYSLSTSFVVTFYPAVIDRMETEYLTYGYKKGDDYNKNEEPRDMILPGQTGILVLDVMPFYSNYDYIEVTYDNFVDLGQFYFLENASEGAYPFERYSNLTYLSRGIRLANVSSNEQGLPVFGKTGRYYISILAPTNTLINQYNLTITAYKQGINTTQVFRMVKTFDCINLPVIELEYRGEQSKNVQEIFIPRGVSDNLDVRIYNSTGEPEISVVNAKNTTETYLLAQVVKENGRYKVEVNKNASIGDQFRIIFKCTKQVGEEIREITQFIDLIVVPYLINDLGFEYVLDGVMREQFGGSYRLALSFENSKFFYDENSEETKQMIINDLAKVSAYDSNTWYAYRNGINSNDYSLGSYYENDYLEIKTRSSLSKDLYVTGKFYDEIETNQKMLGAYIKYYFDKSAKSWVFNKLVKSTTNRLTTDPYAFYSKKSIQNGRFYFEQSKFFNVSFFMNTSMENVKPIYNKQEFQNMQTGMSYILMRDLVLNDFKPVKNQIAYLNGNNKTITIESFNTTDETKIGLFANIAQNTIIENLKIAISANNLNVDLTNKSSVSFGILAAENSGKIYNCSVSYLGTLGANNTLVTTTINGKAVRGTEDYLATLLSGTDNPADNTSGNVIPNSAQGLKLQISVVRVGEGFVSSVMGGLVGSNTGYITNCRIEAGVGIHGYGDIGGLVGRNNGTIASSYSLAQLNSYSTSEEKSNIGGLVGINAGKISLSFAEIRPNANISNTFGGINAVCIAGGFVCENTGTISDCYSNLNVISSASTAGFVSNNNKGTITNSYSASRVRENSKRDMVFVGVDTYNEINNEGDGISDCYFLEGNYANQDLQPAQRLAKADFNDKNKLKTLAFDNSATTNGYISSGVWFIPQVSTGAGDYTGQSFIAEMPTLVSANLISKGYVELLSTDIGDDGNPKYNYSAIIGATLGSNAHPYVVYSAENLNKYVAEARVNGTNDSSNNKSYVLASDITFEDNAKMAETYFTNFEGKIEGNSMVINKLRISYLVATNQGSNDFKNIGLFRELNKATIQNLTFDVEEVYGSAVERVGVLAGTITKSNIFNIELGGTAVVQGKNLVGALAGFVDEGNQIQDIDSTLSVNSVFKLDVASKYNLEVDTDGQGNEDYSKLSYGGGIFGYIAKQTTKDKASKINNLSVSKTTKVLGDVVGGIAGYVGLNNTIKNSETIVSNGMYLKGISAIGGIAGVNLGTIQNAKVQYEKEIQNVLDNFEDVASTAQKSGVGALTGTLAINDFFKYTAALNRTGIIGGIAGINAGDGTGNGIISSSFNKVNIVDKNAKVLGGIVGVCIAGKLDLTYSTALIDMGYRTNDAIKCVGGLIGLNSLTLSDYSNTIPAHQVTENGEIVTIPEETITHSGVLDLICGGTDLKTTINNSVSISTFNFDSVSSYSYQVINEQNTVDHDALAIGGVIGLVEDEAKIEIENVNFNKQIIANQEATTTEVSGNAGRELNPIGKRFEKGDGTKEASEFFGNLTFNEDNPYLQVTTRAFTGATPNLYVQMVSDGRKELDPTEKYYIFSDLSKGVSGRKTEIFAPFIIENYFEFPTIAYSNAIMPIESAFPDLKGVETYATLNEIFSVEDNVIHLQGGDLVKVALIVNSQSAHWKQYDYFSNYILRLETDFNLSSEFRALSEFKGIIDGNGKTISGLNITDNNNSFINKATSANIEKVQFNKVNVNLTNSASGNFGLIGDATNIMLIAVSINIDEFNISNEENENANIGAFAGSITGAGNYIVKSYVNFKKIENAIPTTNNLGAFVGHANSVATKLNIQNSYSNNSANDSQLVEYLANMPIGQITAVNVVNHNNSGASKLGTGTGGTASTCYLSNNGTYVTDTLSQLFANESKWTNGGVATNVWIEAGIWAWESETSTIPIHSFGSAQHTIISTIGDYDSGTQTYTLNNALNVQALAEAINSKTLPNGGDGYKFILNASISNNYYAVDNETQKEYFIYDYGTTNTIIYDNVQYPLTIPLSGNPYITVTGEGGNTEISFTIVNKPLTAIGTEKNPFRGIFEGNNKSISNVTVDAFISQNGVAYGGLFAKTQDAIIRNLTLTNVTINLNETESVKPVLAYMGVVSGLMLSSSVNNVTITTTGTTSITSNLSSAIELYCGGVAGYANGIEVINLNNNESGVTTITLGITTSLQQEASAVGHIVGYLIRNQSYFTEESLTKLSIGATSKRFGKLIETKQDEYNHNVSAS